MREARDAGLLKASPMFVRLDRDGIVWADGTRTEADAIVWCTGFRPALSHLAPLQLRGRRGHIATAGTRAVDESRVHLLVGIAIAAGMVRGNLPLLQATAVTDRWETTHYGRLSGLLAAPATIAAALAPFAGAALAAPLGGYPQLFALLAAISALASALALSSYPARHDGL